MVTTCRRFTEREAVAGGRVDKEAGIIYGATLLAIAQQAPVYVGGDAKRRAEI